MPDAAARVGDIAVEAGDEVHVQMHHRLASSRADIDPDVVAVGLQLGVELGLHHIEQLEHRNLFFSGRLEPGGDQPPRHDERVARRDREAVTNRKGEHVGGYVRVARALEEGRGHGFVELHHATSNGERALILVPKTINKGRDGH